MREYFHENTEEDISLFRNKGTFNPPRGRNHTMDIVLDNLLKLPTIPSPEDDRKRKHNISRDENKAILDIKQNHEWIIKEADKGRAVVLMGKNYYKNKVEIMLNDTSTYLSISQNQDKSIMRALKSFIDGTDATLTKAERDYILLFEYKTSNFYGLPKTHKSNALSNKKPTCDGYLHVPEPADLQFRPIIAGPASPTHRISLVLDRLLRPFLKHVKSYLRDNLHFLKRLPRTVPQEATLVSLDIISLYSNIPHDLGIRAIKYWTQHFPNDIHGRFTETFIVEGTRFVLENNTFMFDNRNFKQISGTAMGTPFAPVFANLTIGFLERSTLHSKLTDAFGVETTTHIENNFIRYIDDCFIIWTLGDDKLKQFIQIINNLDPQIQYTIEMSRTKLPFLDVMVIKKGVRIVCDVFSKPTDSKRYLPFLSSHPRHIKANIPFSLAKRIRTIVDEETTEEKRYQELFTDLTRQGYPSEIINTGINKARALDKRTLLEPTNRSESKDMIPFVSTFNPNNLNLNNVITNNFHTLQQNLDTRNIFGRFNLLNAKRQPKNLKKILCRAKFSQTTEAEIKKCGKARCQLCTCIKTGKHFTFENGSSFTVKNTMTCDATNVIYVLFCAGCNASYIGETTNYRRRINLHREQIANEEHRVLKVSRHIATCARNLQQRFSTLPFYKVFGDTQELIMKETFFINKFKPSLNS